MEKTAEQIREDLKTKIAYENPKIDLISGNVARDIGVDAFSDELAALYTEQDRVRKLYLLDSSVYTYEEANALGASYGVYRLSPTRATGIVTFGAPTRPEPGQVFTVPVGTTVTTSGESSTIKNYTTVTPGYITASSVLNPHTNYYECTVTVQAQVEGTASNVGAGAINQIKSSVNGITVVYNNNAITNGTDEESTEDLIERIKLRLRGQVYGTKASFEAKVYEDPRVLDAVVVDPDSEFSVRGPGTVDIYILGETVGSYTQTIVPAGKTVYLTKHPLINDGNALVTLPDGSTYTQGDAFQLYSDVTSIYASGSRAKDKLVWSDAIYERYIKNVSSYNLTYSYNKLVTDVQETFDSDDIRIVTADVMIRTTHRLNAAMDFDIITLPGYDASSVRNQVLYNIQSFVNNFTLNKTLRQSDIIGIVENTAGVDYVKLPMRQFSLLGQEGVADIESSPLEYIRISADNIKIG